MNILTQNPAKPAVTREMMLHDPDKYFGVGCLIMLIVISNLVGKFIIKGNLFLLILEQIILVGLFMTFTLTSCYHWYKANKSVFPLKNILKTLGIFIGIQILLFFVFQKQLFANDLKGILFLITLFLLQMTCFTGAILGAWLGVKIYVEKFLKK
ncbi:MAG: hypothetical protein WCJ58_09075 [bacterium]